MPSACLNIVLTSDHASVLQFEAQTNITIRCNAEPTCHRGSGTALRILRRRQTPCGPSLCIRQLDRQPTSATTASSHHRRHSEDCEGILEGRGERNRDERGPGHRSVMTLPYRPRCDGRGALLVAGVQFMDGR